MPDPRGAVAALDCGTNSTRLLIVGPEGEFVDRQIRVTRLGEGVDTNRKLSAEAIERTLAVLRDYRLSMERNGVIRARMVATSAARDASNSQEFLSAAEGVTGVEPELLSGDEEGRLSFRGATADLPEDDTPSGTEELVVDIGGGSTELVVGVPGGTDDSIRALSMDIGCVRVTERFFDSDPLGRSAARRCSTRRGRRAGERAGSLQVRGGGGRVIGLAGTVSTLGSLLDRARALRPRSRPPHRAQLRRRGGLALPACIGAPVCSRSDRVWNPGERT